MNGRVILILGDFFRLSVYATVAVLSHEPGCSLGSGVMYEVFRTKSISVLSQKKECSKENKPDYSTIVIKCKKLCHRPDSTRNARL